MDVDPITWMFMLLGLGGGMFLYVGLPLICPALFLVWRRHVLARPWAFVAIAVILCGLAKLAIYLAQWAFLEAGGKAFIGTPGFALWFLAGPWLMEVCIAVLIVLWLGRKFRAET